uniref:ParB/Sulfiredoxin domain-containing protein n=1 Tax=Panagrolaimus superbus TaxID=310955 RepID=A0A914Z501_9BILA
MIYIITFFLTQKINILIFSCNVNADHTNFEVFLRNFNLEFEKDKIFDPHELHFDQEIRDLNDEHVTWLYNKIEKNFENARFWFTATPIIGYIDSEKIYIADGNHRLAAAQRFNELNGSKKINNFPVSFLILSKITHAQKLVLMSMAEEKVYENRKPLTKYEILKNARILLKNCPEVLKLPPLPENATTSEQNDYSKKCVQAIMGFFHVCHPSLVLSNIWKATRITDNDFDKMYPHFKNLPSGFDVNDFDVVFNKYLLSPIKITELMTMEKFPKLEIFRKMLRKDVKKEVIPLLKHLKAYEYSWDDFQHMKFIAGEKYVTSQGTNHTNTVLQHYLSAKGRELRHHKTVSKKLMYLQKHFSLW